MSELKIKDIVSLNKLVDALCHNGYRLQIATVYKPWPQNGIDYFAVKVEGGADRA
jgi:hypothetical protein